MSPLFHLQFSFPQSWFPFRVWMWFWASWSFPYSFLYEIFCFSSYFPSFWCWSHFSCSYFVSFLSYFFIFATPPNRSIIWVFIWWFRLISLVQNIGFSCLIILSGVFLSVAGTILCIHPFAVWCFLVVGTVTTTAWLKLKLPSIQLASYFVISVVGSLLFLFSSLVSSSHGALFGLSLFLLIGVPPFQFWVIRILPCLDLPSAIIFLGPLKTGYIFLLLYHSSSFFLLGALSFVFGIYLLWSSVCLPLVIFGSQCCNLTFLLFLSSSLATVFWLIYCFSLFALVFVSFSLLSPFMGLAILVGIPPLGIFWAKALSFSSLPLLTSIFLILPSALTLYPYLFLGSTILRKSSSSFIILALYAISPLALLLLSGLW